MSLGRGLFGRDAVLAAASAVLGDAEEGAGQFLLVSGEAGIGKSSVLAALIEQAEDSGAVILRGFCWEGTGVPPYWPWSQVMRATGLSGADLGAAARLVDDSPASDAPMDSAAAVDAQFRLFEAVATCLRDLSEQRFVTVAIDDLHWADDSSLRLLGFLSKALAGSAVLVLGAYRDLEATAELRLLAGTSQQLALTGLSPSEVEAMVAAMPGLHPGPRAVGQLWQRSGGNPFFVRELTRLLVAQGSSAERDSSELVTVPASVAETLRRRLARLSNDTARLLNTAAVIGRDIDVGLLAQIGVDEATVGVMMDEALAAGVLGGTGRELRFVHDLYRETILASLSASESAATNLAVGRALLTRPGDTSAARIAGHLLAGGSGALREGIDYSIRAGHEATAGLGHGDACAHYLRALGIMDANDLGEPVQRAQLLLLLAAAHERTGATDLAMQRFREVALLGRDSPDPVLLARGALGMQALGERSGFGNVELRDLLQLAADSLLEEPGTLSLRSQVYAALARSLRHATATASDPRVIPAAKKAVELAVASGDDRAVATAQLALQDSMWTPGSAATRLPVISGMLEAAQACGDKDLVAEAHLLRAAALIELGDPTGRAALLTYTAMADGLGHARGRWGALTRRATFAQIAGHTDEAARLAVEGYRLGLAIGIPDAVGCFCSLRWSLVALGGAEVSSSELDGEMAMGMDSLDPLWPMFPMFDAWAPAVRGDVAATRSALGDFSVLDIPTEQGLEALAVAAVVFGVAGSPEQRTWTYKQLQPFAGSHIIISGCASYHAAVDHHLGALAASLGDLEAAAEHFRAARAMHERLGAAGWLRLTETALSELLDRTPERQRNEMRRREDRWRLLYDGEGVELSDSKGLRDLAALIAAQGRGVHVLTLIGQPQGAPGADPVLDDRAKAEYRARLTALTTEIDQAEGWHDLGRADTLREEREALLQHLAAASGLSGRPRRLGDQTERARKTVSARVRDALAKIDRIHPTLAAHLRGALDMGTVCSYSPMEPTTWTVG
jgi:tetratricopeptide (TPR) repeat protein